MYYLIKFFIRKVLSALIFFITWVFLIWSSLFLLQRNYQFDIDVATEKLSQYNTALATATQYNMDIINHAPYQCKSEL